MEVNETALWSNVWLFFIIFFSFTHVSGLDMSCSFLTLPWPLTHCLSPPALTRQSPSPVWGLIWWALCHCLHKTLFIRACICLNIKRHISDHVHSHTHTWTHTLKHHTNTHSVKWNGSDLAKTLCIRQVGHLFKIQLSLWDFYSRTFLFLCSKVFRARYVHSIYMEKSCVKEHSQFVWLEMRLGQMLQYIH